jgi:membrane fusion protein (multidrug efflux system)
MVAVVDDQNRITLRQVTTGEQVGSLWIIAQGLKPGERVVVEGTQKVKEGMQVVAKAYQGSTGAAARQKQ